ncbi:unnamed protein product [Brassica oleracea var. botrytis]|uniref:(rape) hypothetical protein n=1 Tax=Brassica napus TaxID=3708 RepID=A0A816K4L6_BRANA|nr:unnamed protein product [Brassica napus]
MIGVPPFQASTIPPEPATPRRWLSATAHLATDGKLCASEIYGVADNVNGTAARFVNSSFNRLNLFGLRSGYMYYSHGCCQSFSLLMSLN